MDDNRRRISENLLQQIEQYEGKDFSEKLLKWKNGSDKVSIDYDYIESAIERETDKVVEELRR